VGPLSVGEILDAGFALMRQHFGTLVACVLVPLIPLMALGTILQAVTDPNAFDVDAPATDTGAAWAGLIISTALQSVAAALAVAACFKVVSAAHLGEHARAGESLRYGLSRLLPLIAAYLAVWLILIPGFLLLLVPGVWLAVRLAMTFPVVVAERAGPLRAIGRSWTLTDGHFWRTFATLLVLVLIAFVTSIVFLGVVGAIGAAAGDISEVVFALVSTLVTIVASAVLYPLVAAVLTVVYYDLRVRGEGLDLRRLARGVESGFGSAPERPAAPA
jgi:Membrane domain of glycerophosphoryl diester phosphodiesterase